MIQPIVLCGGNGNRLWPLSRTSYPKQLLAPFGDLSLLQQTAKRFFSSQYKPPIFVCNEEYRFLVLEQLKEIGLESPTIILEPESRDTANAIALALHYIAKEDEYSIIVPSDHLIKNETLFHSYVEEALKGAEKDCIITFGIEPNQPATGYGYIKPSSTKVTDHVFKIKHFLEKPDSQKAQQLINEKCYWNGGIFLSKNKTMLDAIKTHLPTQYELTKEAIECAQKDLDFIRIDKEIFPQCTGISIDFGIMEKINNAAIILCSDMGWSDVGNWQSVWENHSKDTDGNAITGDIIIQDVENSYLRSEGLLVSAIGLKDMIVVASSDALLIAHKDYAEKVKEMALSMRQKMRSEADVHQRVYRPWGYYQEIDRGERFKVKRLMVKPLQKTSLQIHHHRSEHWVVVKGTAKVVLGTDELLVHENESIYIPVGMQHSIQNPGKIDLHLIEVQAGSYLGEDDIIRL